MTIPDFVDTLLYEQERFREQVKNHHIWSEFISNLDRKKEVSYGVPCVEHLEILEIIEFLEFIDGNGWKVDYIVEKYYSHYKINFSIQRMNI